MLRTLAASLLLVAAPALAQETAPPAPSQPSDPVPSEPAASQQPAAPAPARALGDVGRFGVALLGIGALGAASTAAGATLLEAVSKNDTNPGAPPDNPELVQVSGFVVVTATSLSAAVMLVGAAMIANDLAD